MKKTVLGIFLLLCAATFCFAEMPPAPSNATSSEAPVNATVASAPAVAAAVEEPPKNLKTFTGRVTFVDLGDDLGVYKGRLTVVNEGQKFVFEVLTGKTKLFDIKGKSCSIRGVRNNDVVAIQYVANAKNHKIAWIVKVKETSPGS
jgi:hypothetical protein